MLPDALLYNDIVSSGGGSVFAFLFCSSPIKGSPHYLQDPWQNFRRWLAIIQSKVAIFRPVLGRAFSGHPDPAGFLPAKNTDFIFSVWRGTGISVLPFLLVYVFHYQNFKSGIEAKDTLPLYLRRRRCHVAFQLLVNVGIHQHYAGDRPAPAWSAMGKFLLTTMISLGLVLSVAAHSDTSIF